jgi:hypothetical protein
MQYPGHSALGAFVLAALATTGCATICPLAVPVRTGSTQACAADPGARDDDRDGLSDACEDAVAERFAPVVHHAEDEPNLPVDVDAMLASTALFFYDDACSPDLQVRLKSAPTQRELLGRALFGGCGATDTVSSSGTRSTRKQRTFFLEDVPMSTRGGSRDPHAWTTYTHVYASEHGGLTLQYWRLYAYNDGSSQHGGDWEGMHVVLDARLEPVFVRLLGHSSIEEVAWRDLEVEHGHVHVWSEPGGHSTRASGPHGSVIRHETWSGGRATWPDGRAEAAARLVNVGEKEAPVHGQFFIAYSGLWGSPGLLFITSGYWGPAFNETSMRGSFVTAWCLGMTGPRAERECAPRNVTR